MAPGGQGLPLGGAGAALAGDVPGSLHFNTLAFAGVVPLGHSFNKTFASVGGVYVLILSRFPALAGSF